MKTRLAIFLFSGMFLLTGCPSSENNYETPLERIQNNNMDFPDLRSQYFGSIEFKLSELFENDYDDSYVISDEYLTRSIYEMSLNFGVEVFNIDEAEVFQYGFDEEIDLLDAVHDHYAFRRIESLEEPKVAIKKELPKNIKFPGYIQVISGASYSYDDPATYFMATMEIDDEFYVFQLIGNEKSVGYLYDDFIDILESVKL